MEGACIGLKLVEFALQGEVYHLLLNGAALFDAYDRFGDKGDLIDRVIGADKASFENTVWMLVKLAQQGEAYRRYMNEEPRKMLTAEAAMRTMGPKDVVRARAAIRQAFAAGFEMETISEEAEVDLGLMELQKKTGLVLPERSGLFARLSSLVFPTGKP